MDRIKKVFYHQFWHLVSVVVLLLFVKYISEYFPSITDGNLWGISTKVWLWVAVCIPILHQIYVWLVWRMELYYSFFTKRYGLLKAFKVYKVGFSILFVSRLIFITILAISNQNSLDIEPYIVYSLASPITLVVLYLFYSVGRYFGVKRAYGIDHFDKNYREPFVKKGIFRFTNNGMYIYGLMILYLPGLLLFSKAALLVALFNHIYIWVHYYCTERPDMREIYGKTPSQC